MLARPIGVRYLLGMAPLTADKDSPMACRRVMLRGCCCLPSIVACESAAVEGEAPSGIPWPTT